ncbi:MAG: ATP-dependent sacrificial sulfur transferase LarE [Nitrospirae bacterium]|nr:ATP-dependent sacrificial sulfur transferase LarE [Nitrospirota bacterium]
MPAEAVIEQEADEKLRRLQDALREWPNALVAFSGGVDSAFLLRVAADTLGRERVCAFTALSQTVPEQDARDASELASSIGVEHIVLRSGHLQMESFLRNDADRCYFCKDEIYSIARKVADERGSAVVLDGTNADDLSDVRPGLRAAKELGVQSPLAEAGLTKAEIRELSRRLGLPTWDRPASPCLSSRFPKGLRITPEGLSSVGQGEAFLRSLGFREFRLRNHGDIARLELRAEDFERMQEGDVRSQIASRLKELGFKFVCVDLEPFRSGRMNEV